MDSVANRIIQIDYANGLVLWWKKTISAFSEEGYKQRLDNIVFTYKGEQPYLNNNNQYWDRDELWRYILVLIKKDERNRLYREATNFIRINVTNFVKTLDSVDSDTIEVTISDTSFTVDFDCRDDNEKHMHITRQYDFLRFRV